MPIRRYDIHIGYHHIGFVRYAVRPYSYRRFPLHDDFINGCVVMKLYPLSLGEGNQAIGDINHTFFRNKRAIMLLEVLNQGHHTGGLIGIGAVIGRKAIVELHQMRFFQSAGVDLVQGGVEFVGKQMENALQSRFVEISAPFV